MFRVRVLGFRVGNKGIYWRYMGLMEKKMETAAF